MNNELAGWCEIISASHFVIYDITETEVIDFGGFAAHEFSDEFPYEKSIFDKADFEKTCNEEYGSVENFMDVVFGEKSGK